MNSTRREFIKQSTLASLAVMSLGTSLLTDRVKAAESTFTVAKGELTEDGDWMVAKTAATLTFDLPQQQDIIRIQGKMGSVTENRNLTITLKSATEKPLFMRMGVSDLPVYWGKQKGKDFPDAALRLRPPGGDCIYYVRPKITIYDEETRAEIAAKWDSLPPASAHPFVLELRRAGNVLQIWMDGQFMSEVPVESTFTQCEITLSEGAALRAVQAEKATQEMSDGIQPLPINAYPRPGVMKGAKISLLPDAKLPAGLAVSENAGESTVSIEGLGRISAARIDLENYRWRISAVDNIAETSLFSVPLATYSHATFLCAAEDDPARSPSFTVRLTRYADSRGDAMGDTVVKLPDSDKSTFNSEARRVGEVTYTTNSAQKTVPLWLLRVPLKAGQIQDLLYDDQNKNRSFGTHRYLDCQLMDPVQNVEEAEEFPPPMEAVDRIYYPGQVPNYKYYIAPDPVTGEKHRPGDVRSSVHVFAAALEQSPAAMDVRANVPWLIFYESDNPVLRATVTARVAGKYTVEWTFADVEGRIVAADKKQIALSSTGAKEVIEVPVNAQTGWYATRFRLLDDNDRELIDHKSTFVMLPPDTRRAGFESPYGTWWFHWAHGGEPNIEMVGPVLERAGIRHTLLPDNLPEETTKKYQVTATQIPWKRTTGTVQERVDQYEAWIAKNLQLWPSVTTMLVWHESGDAGAPFPPPELWGGTPKAIRSKIGSPVAGTH